MVDWTPRKTVHRLNDGTPYGSIEVYPNKMISFYHCHGRLTPSPAPSAGSDPTEDHSEPIDPAHCMIFLPPLSSDQD